MAFNDGGSGTDSSGGVLPPGGTHTYVWQVPERAGPGPDDPSSIGWLYHDHSTDMGIPGTNSGLVGPMVITRRGGADRHTVPRDVDREVFVLFNQFDENRSPYLKENISRYGRGRRGDVRHGDFERTNRKQCINGFMFGNGPVGTSDGRPALVIGKNTAVRWYVIGLGGRSDSHSPHWHGNTVTVRGHRADVVTVLPATVVTADMRPDNPGTWLFHCHVDEHMLSGMTTRYRVD